MELRIQQPVRDTGANCARCELEPRHRAGQVCFSAAPLPHKWNGIMVVGEGPGRTEVARGKPFVGKSGELLTALMASEGFKLEECFVTNATLCLPDSTQGTLTEQAPNAVHACLPRLEREIALVKPRVIIALGNAALQALTGAEEKYEKREAFTCDYCGEDRKVDGVACPAGACQHVWEGTDNALKPADCPQCGVTWKRVKVRRVKCPKCNSLKMRTVQKTRFNFDYKIGEVAGAVIDAAKHGWDEFGVKYIIPTYHPSFLLHSVEAKGSGEKKTMAGQFAAKTVQRHLRKALHLVSNDIDWKFAYEVTSSDDDMDAADHLLEYIYGDPNVRAFTLDVETEAWGTHYICTDAECGKKSGIEHPVNHETAPELPRAFCKACAKWTRQTPQRGELDARELENVTEIKVLGFGSEARGLALVVDTRKLGPHMPNLREAVRRVLTDKNIAKCAHHGTYDMPVIERLWGMRVVNYLDDTLMMHHVLAPDEKHDLAHLAFRYTYARIWKPPKILKGHVAHQTFAELCEYNARDVMLTDAVRTQMSSEMVRKGNTAGVYALDMELQQQALDMQRNGLPVDMAIAREVGAKALRLREIALKEMRVTARNPDFNPNSPEQLIHVLYDMLAYPVLAYTDGGKSGNKRPSTAKDVVLRLPDTAFKRSLLEYVDANKTLKAYFDVSGGQAEPSRGLNLWADKRAHAVWKPFGTRTGRFTSNPNCFDGETEVLTPAGWVRFDTVKPEVHTCIAQFEPEHGITFAKPTQWIKKRHEGSMVNVRTVATRLQVTPEHRCLLRNRKTGEFRVFSGATYPEDWQQLHAAASPKHGTVSLTPAQVTLLCAVQADGTFPKGGKQVVFAFDKERKKERLQDALLLHGVPFKRKDALEGAAQRKRTRFTVQQADIADVLSWLDNKVFRWRLLHLDPDARDLFVHELAHWDGHLYQRNNGAFTYSSSIRQNVDVAQALICMQGFRAKVREYQPLSPRAVVNYQLDVVTSDCSMTTNRERTEVPWAGDVYCVSVPSSYIVVRREGRIHITGQCQNHPKWLRAMFVAPPGRKIVGADMDQLELRIVAGLCGDENLIHRCLTADETRKLEPDHDPHSYVASLAFGVTFTDLLLKDPAHNSDPNYKCKCQTCERKALRDLCKRVIYGLNYGAGDATVFEAIYNGGYNGPPITIEMIGRVRTAIFRAFPKILTWRETKVKLANQQRAVFSALLGRWRTFPLGDIPATEIYNFDVQATGADLMNIQGTAFYKNVMRKVDPSALYIAQIHDANYYEVNERRADDFAYELGVAMSWKGALYKGGPEMPYTATGNVANNLKDA